MNLIYNKVVWGGGGAEKSFFQKVVTVFLLVGMDFMREPHQNPREQQLLQPPIHHKDSSICENTWSYPGNITFHICFYFGEIHDS